MMSKPSAAILLEDGQFRNGRQVVVGHRSHADLLKWFARRALDVGQAASSWRS
jgi:hypothetical protein